MYGAVPPEAEAVAAPFAAPHVASVVASILAEGPPMSFIVAVAVEEHPFASVIVTVYVPAANPVAVADVCAGEVFQLYVYGAVPPEAEAVAEPFAAPQVASIVASILAVGPPEAPFMVAVRVVEQPPASETVTLYTPGAKLVAVAVVWGGEVFQLYAKGGVPEFTVTVAEPSVLPQLASVVLDMVASRDESAKHSCKS